MSISKVQINEPKRRNAILPMAAVGAAAGMGARYVVPTKTEMKGLLSKENIDKFVSTASTTARANGRSVLKYAGVGAAIAAGLSAIKAFFKASNKEFTTDGTEY